MGKNMEKIVSAGDRVFNLGDNRLYDVQSVSEDYLFTCKDSVSDELVIFDIRQTTLEKVMQ